MSEILVKFNVKRFDCQDPDQIYTLNVDHDISYTNFKKEVLKLLNIASPEERILKVRNNDGVLIPLMSVLEVNDSKAPVILEITKVHQNVPAISCESNMNSVYIDALRSKIRCMESRISRIESVAPEMKWQRQSLVEHTANSLVSRIAFLDKRIDELIPPQWNEKLQTTTS